jgi:hypothetical protein
LRRGTRAARRTVGLANEKEHEYGDSREATDYVPLVFAGKQSLFLATGNGFVGLFRVPILYGMEFWCIFGHVVIPSSD